MHFAALMILASTLVLRSGDRITVEGPVRVQEGVATFRSGGALYSVPASQIDAASTKAANEPPAPAKLPGKLKVSAAERDRLLRDLETNHTGQAPREQKWETQPLPIAQVTTQENNPQEWQWRREARAFEESVRQAKENLQLLRERAESLRDEIRGLLSLGWKPQSFSYQTTQLANTIDQIPAAELEVKRAERAWDQFRDDARRQGIMPGWLR